MTDASPLPNPRSGVPLPWLEVLETGYAEIDSDHRRLVDDTNALLEALSEAASRPDLPARLRAMEAACAAHFRREEALLEREGFLASAAHRQEHLRIEGEIAGLVARLDRQEPTADAAETAEAVLAFRLLLLEHLLYYDLAYKSHLQDRQGR